MTGEITGEKMYPLRKEREVIISENQSSTHLHKKEEPSEQNVNSQR